ncbi:MAG: hypothetical protein JNK41_08085 [Saprospiraceae bacterium]|jgi:tetratricopeptide (TPR) repeat protein|nr:hypothetical protein [Saprospiraceae bacterium]
MNNKFYSLFCIISLVLTISSCKSDKKSDIPASPTTNNPVLDELNERINKNPKDHNALYKRAEIYYEKEAYDESIADLENAIKIDSLQPMYYHLLADNYLDYFKSRQALETMEKVSNLFPKRIETLLKLAEFQLILKRYEDAQLSVQRILQIQPQNAEAYLMGGMIFKDMGDEVRARAGLQKAIELGLLKDSDQIDAYINLGQLNIKKDKKLAEKYFDNAIKLDSTNINALHAKADFFQATNQLNQAIGLYRKIIGIDSAYSKAYFNTGILYMEMDSLDKAIKNFDIATKVEPTEASYYLYRGKAKEKQGKKLEAKQDYEQALKFDANLEEAKQALQKIK